MSRVRPALLAAFAMTALLALAASSPTAAPLAAQSAPPDAPVWLRNPAISPDGQTIAFTWKGDIYRVPSAGGAAVPLSTHEAHDTQPVWSHDGRTIAFASDRHGNFDVFIMPASGGPARRLTYHSTSETPFSFTPDDTAVLFGAARSDTAANRLFPTGSGDPTRPTGGRVPADDQRTKALQPRRIPRARSSRSPSG